MTRISFASLNAFGKERSTRHSMITAQRFEMPFSEPYSEGAQSLGYPRSAGVEPNTEEDELSFVDMTKVD